jgi:hypothetical protein
MSYTLIKSEITDEALTLTSREWEMLRKLAAEPPGWKPQGDRDYTRGWISPEEATDMAESVKGQLAYLWRERPDAQAEEPHSLFELRDSLGYVEGDPHTFFGDQDRRRKVEAFVLLASAGPFEVLPHLPEEEKGEQADRS